MCAKKCYVVIQVNKIQLSFTADDDFVISDEEMEVRDVSSEEESNPYGRRKNEDSDFVMEEDDSGSDWETSKKTGTPRGGGRSKSGSVSHWCS